MVRAIMYKSLVLYTIYQHFLIILILIVALGAITLISFQTFLSYLLCFPFGSSLLIENINGNLPSVLNLHV